jgi:hypothetical protein
MSKDIKKLKYNTLISVLSRGSTGEARQLLKKHSGQDATNYSDLEFKLAKFYANSPDKVTLEKEFANIHPHKDFILKYLAPATPIDVPLIADTKTDNPKNDLTSNAVVVHDGYSNAGGDCYSNCEGCGGTCGKKTQPMSGADGGSTGGGMGSNNQLMVLGLVAIVAMFGLVIIKNK